MPVKKITQLFWIFSLSFFSYNTWGLETFKHPHCNYYLHNVDLSNKELNLLRDSLKDKGYILQEKKEKVEPLSFYVDVEKTLTGKFYKECLIEIKISQAARDHIKKDDDVIYKSSSLRKFPRQSFDGEERCFMALKDLLFNINICKTGK